MPESPTFDVAIIGGGIIGLATAMALKSSERLSLVVLEAEPAIASHQTGHNSGVIHSGTYYKPGSLKARMCIEGRQALHQFCAERRIAHERCGKLIIAAGQRELPALDELERRGKANGISVTRLSAEEIRAHEPHAGGTAGLLVRDAGIVDFSHVARAMAAAVRERGGEVRNSSALTGCVREQNSLLLRTAGGEVRARFIINCAGLQSDRIARMCGENPDVRIIPFRGEYFELAPQRRQLVRNLIYPVPDARFPFLGVHLTRTIGGRVEAGPNALPALARHGYQRGRIDPRDAVEMMLSARFWRLIGRYWRTGLGELHRSLSAAALARSLQRLVPELGEADLASGPSVRAGVRAQAVDSSGRLVDDFRILHGERAIHVLNAPSPAATASIAIGRFIADEALRRLADARR